MGARRRGRILAFQSLYAYELGAGGERSGQDHKERRDAILQLPWLDQREREKTNQESIDFARLIASGAIENLPEIDRHIKAQLEHWDFSRLNKVDQAILRMSVYSLLFQQEIPVSVTIDEAVELSKDFGTDESYRFINGVLDGIRKNVKR
jgi:N utilization substance protein B